MWANPLTASAGVQTGPDSGRTLLAPGDDGGIPVQDGRAAAVAKSRRLPPAPATRLSAGNPSAAISDRLGHASRGLARDRNPPVSALESRRPARPARSPLPPSQAPPSA